MALTVGTDTYISVADATTYLGTQLGGAAWTAASAGDKENALRMAGQRLERVFYLGEATVSTQTLRWPRTGVYDQHGTELSSTAVPEAVKDAQCWDALHLLQWAAAGAGNSDREELQLQGVGSVKLGDTQEVYRDGHTGVPGALAPMAWRCLTGLTAHHPSWVMIGV